MKKLIVNADDFGLHPLINAGIIKGYREGFITSTSLMPSAPCWQEAVQLAQENPQLGIGVHLTLVGSVAPVLPAGKVSSLLDEQGLFFGGLRCLCQALLQRQRQAQRAGSGATRANRKGVGS